MLPINYTYQYVTRNKERKSISFCTTSPSPLTIIDSEPEWRITYSLYVYIYIVLQQKII